MDYPSLNKLFLDAVDRYANPKAQISKTANGWESICAGEMLRRVAGLSKALANLGSRQAIASAYSRRIARNGTSRILRSPDWARRACRSISTSPWTG